MANYNGQNLAYLFIQRGMRCKDVAKLIGVSPSCVSKWEHGKNLINNKNFEKLASVFNMRFDELHEFLCKDIDVV